MNQFSLMLRIPFVKSAIRRLTAVEDPSLALDLFETRFKNPVGLAAGFDKDARWISQLSTLGFSHIEVGTLTGHAQPGNPTPRLFRLSQDQALLNCMGFNNRGSAAAEESLRQSGQTGRPQSDGDSQEVRLGINIGLTKSVAETVQKESNIQLAIEDYLLSFRRVLPFADYITVNVSSPNTPGLRDLQHPSKLGELIEALVSENRRQAAADSEVDSRPILVKLAPDLSSKELDETLEALSSQPISGVIATNTTVSAENLKTCPNQVKKLRGNCPENGGGLSGKPLTQKSRDFVRRIFKRTDGKLKIIGVGGVMSGQDAWDLIAAGASLVQVYTGFVYGGPFFIKSINRFLSQEMLKRNIHSIQQVTGIDV